MMRANNQTSNHAHDACSAHYINMIICFACIPLAVSLLCYFWSISNYVVCLDIIIYLTVGSHLHTQPHTNLSIMCCVSMALLLESRPSSSPVFGRTGEHIYSVCHLCHGLFKVYIVIIINTIAVFSRVLRVSCMRPSPCFNCFSPKCLRASSFPHFDTLFLFAINFAITFITHSHFVHIHPNPSQNPCCSVFVRMAQYVVHYHSIDEIMFGRYFDSIRAKLLLHWQKVLRDWSFALDIKCWCISQKRRVCHSGTPGCTASQVHVLVRFPHIAGCLRSLN